VHVFAVPCQAAGHGKGLAAGGARVGVVAGMGVFVVRQAAGRRAGIAAGGAGVGAVAGMGSNVLHQVTGHRAGLAAGGAGVGAVASIVSLKFETEKSNEPPGRKQNGSTRNAARVSPATLSSVFHASTSIATPENIAVAARTTVPPRQLPARRPDPPADPRPRR